MSEEQENDLSSVDVEEVPIQEEILEVSSGTYSKTDKVKSTSQKQEIGQYPDDLQSEPDQKRSNGNTETSVSNRDIESVSRPESIEQKKKRVESMLQLHYTKATEVPAKSVTSNQTQKNKNSFASKNPKILAMEEPESVANQVSLSNSSLIDNFERATNAPHKSETSNQTQETEHSFPSNDSNVVTKRKLEIVTNKVSPNNLPSGSSLQGSVEKTPDSSQMQTSELERAATQAASSSQQPESNFSKAKIVKASKKPKRLMADGLIVGNVRAIKTNKTPQNEETLSTLDNATGLTYNPTVLKVLGRPLTENEVTKKYVIIRGRSSIYEKPFICLFCGKDMSDSKYIVEHIRVHTGEKPFKCQYCDKRFSKRFNMHSHLRIHTGEAKFKCSICAKTFDRRGKFEAHVQAHKTHFRKIN